MKKALILTIVLPFWLLTACGLYNYTSNTSSTEPSSMQEVASRYKHLAYSMKGNSVNLLYSRFGDPDKVVIGWNGYKTFYYFIDKATPFGLFSCECSFLVCPSTSPPYVGTVSFKDKTSY